MGSGARLSARQERNVRVRAGSKDSCMRLTARQAWDGLQWVAGERPAARASVRGRKGMLGSGTRSTAPGSAS